MCYITQWLMLNSHNKIFGGKVMPGVKPTPDKPLVSIKEAMRLLQLNRMTIDKIIRERQLPAIKLGERFYLRRTDIDYLLGRNEVVPGTADMAQGGRAA